MLYLSQPLAIARYFPTMRGMSDAGERLAKYVRDRRNAAGLSQEEAAAQSGGLVKTPNWRKIEAGERPNVRPRTALGLERALEWDRGSVAAILAGGKPTDSPAVQIAGLDQDTYVLLTAIDDLTEKVRILEVGFSRLARLEETVAEMAKQLHELGEQTTLPDDDEGPSLGETDAGL